MTAETAVMCLAGIDFVLVIWISLLHGRIEDLERRR